MKVTVLKNEPKGKSSSIVSSIVFLILGIILTFRSSEFIGMVFTVLGFLILLFGVYKFFQYYNMKQQLQVANEDFLMNGILYTFLGLITIILASFFASTVQMITGIWLVFVGMQKVYSSRIWKDVNRTEFYIQLISGLVLIFLGIYTMVAQNLVFIFIGIALIVYSIMDIVHVLFQAK